MQQSNRRMRAQLEGAPGLQLRRLNDPEGDAGGFLIFLVESEAKAIQMVQQMREAGLQIAVRLADFFGCSSWVFWGGGDSGFLRRPGRAAL